MKSFKEIRKILAEVAEAQQRSQKDMERIQKSVGEIGNKFGTFTEGLTQQSLRNILSKNYGMDGIWPNAHIRKNGEEIELDILAWANGTTNTSIIVEVKSHLREEDLKQAEKHAARFFDFFPEHRGKKLLVMVACVSSTPGMKERVLKKGMLFIRVADDVFTLDTPPDFQPKDFSKPD